MPNPDTCETCKHAPEEWAWGYEPCSMHVVIAEIAHGQTPYEMDEFGCILHETERDE